MYLVSRRDRKGNKVRGNDKDGVRRLVKIKLSVTFFAVVKPVFWTQQRGGDYGVLLGFGSSVTIFCYDHETLEPSRKVRDDGVCN